MTSATVAAPAPSGRLFRRRRQRAFGHRLQGVCCLLTALAAPASAALPDWLQIDIDQRTRVEYLDGSTRIGSKGQDHQTDLRTGLRLHAEGDDFFATLDIVDARAIWHPDDTRINTGVVNTLEPVEALIGLDWKDALGEGTAGRIRVGRQTLDLGSRRLVARNRWRNTTNAFVGVGADWSYASGTQVTAFAYAPLNRQPFLPDALRDGEWEWDDAGLDQRFLGLFASTGNDLDVLEGYVFRLDEGDRSKAPTRNRHLWTLGGRVLRQPQPGRWSWDIEAALQVGSSRSTRLPVDQEDLDHFAHFQHLDVGYTFDAPLQPQLALEIDHATGDDDPDDGKMGRFDHLFGAAVGDMGYRGLYFAFARTNVILAGMMLNMQLSSSLDLTARVRGAWLTESRDLWFPTGFGNRTVGADRELGIHSEVLLQWQPAQLPFSMNFGAAYLDKGSFNDDPNVNVTDSSNVIYGYAEIAFSL